MHVVLKGIFLGKCKLCYSVLSSWRLLEWRLSVFENKLMKIYELRDRDKLRKLHNKELNNSRPSLYIQEGLLLCITLWVCMGDWRIYALIVAPDGGEWSDSCSSRFNHVWRPWYALNTLCVFHWLSESGEDKFPTCVWNRTPAVLPVAGHFICWLIPTCSFITIVQLFKYSGKRQPNSDVSVLRTPINDQIFESRVTLAWSKMMP
jgi:hypothetical protein